MSPLSHHPEFAEAAYRLRRAKRVLRNAAHISESTLQHAALREGRTVHWMDRLGEWRTRRSPARPYSPNLLDHTLDIAGWNGSLSDRDVRVLVQAGRAVLRVDWRGCMAETRHEDGVGRVVGLSVYRLNGYTNWQHPNGTLGALIDYGDGAVWTDFSRLRFVGVWPYTIEEWT